MARAASYRTPGGSRHRPGLSDLGRSRRRHETVGEISVDAELDQGVLI
jgi:hypothetical protein